MNSHGSVYIGTKLMARLKKEQETRGLDSVSAVIEALLDPAELAVVTVNGVKYVSVEAVRAAVEQIRESADA